MFSNLRDFGVVPFVKAETEEDALLTAQALVAGGLPIMELVFSSFAHSRGDPAGLQRRCLISLSAWETF